MNVKAAWPDILRNDMLKYQDSLCFELFPSNVFYPYAIIKVKSGYKIKANNSFSEYSKTYRTKTAARRMIGLVMAYKKVMKIA